MRIDVNGVGINYQVTGEGRPVVLLHGFPDSGRLWRNQVPALAEAGFRVIVPDLRGFGGSDKPEAVDAYALPHSVGDLVAILSHLGCERAHFVGHDWGAAVGWITASMAAPKVDHLVALSVGHPAALRPKGIPELARFWYVLLFQFPGVAEKWLTANNWAGFRAFLQHPDADGVIADLESTGSLTSGLNWYRANPFHKAIIEPAPQLPPVQAPTMGMWSTGDPALGERQMVDSQEHIAGPWRYERVEGPGHWMQLEAPERINELLLEFLPR